MTRTALMLQVFQVITKSFKVTERIWMCKNVQRNAPDRIKRTQQIERLGRAEPKDAFVSRHDHKRLQTSHSKSTCR